MYQTVPEAPSRSVWHKLGSTRRFCWLLDTLRPEIQCQGKFFRSITIVVLQIDFKRPPLSLSGKGSRRIPSFGVTSWWTANGRLFEKCVCVEREKREKEKKREKERLPHSLPLLFKEPHPT